MLVGTYPVDPVDINYEDEDYTPDVAIGRDRLGRLFTVTQANQSKITYEYDPANLALDTETVQYDLDHNGAYEFTRVIDRSRDAFNRNNGWQLKDETHIENQVTYGYEAATGLLGTVTGGDVSHSFTYGYLANSNLIQTVAATSGAVHNVTNIWEPNRDVLDVKQTKVGEDTISKYDYAVNEIGQRTGVAMSSTVLPALPSWTWGYDSLGQVTSADSSADTSDRGYLYDAIGNRRGQQAGSITIPMNTQGEIDPDAGTTTYSANALNQYAGTGAIGGGLNAAPVFDEDGNMTTGPLSGTGGSAANHLKWDAENRLVQVRTVDNTAAIATTLYDAQSRRIAETIGSTTTLYIYDGWNCIAEYTGASLTKTRTWGLDISGSLQGAGGVGGLLAENQGGNSFFPTYDGNGNVSEYLTTAGVVAARFEYDPFGNTLVNTDSGNQFAYRFSTKPLNFITGLYYYGFRYYEPVTGRWPSRDLIEEEGGGNLYGFVFNDSIDFYDVDGLYPGETAAGRLAAAALAKAALAVKDLATKNKDLIRKLKRCDKTPEEMQELIESRKKLSDAERAYDKAEKAARDAGVPKAKKSGLSGKEAADDKPSWVKEGPKVGESSKEFSKRQMDEKYGAGNWKGGAASEANQIQKWAERASE